MRKDKLAGHLAIAATYTIFGLNIVFCKDIANNDVISPMVLFTLRAIGASALFWLISLVLPKERIDTKDLPKIALASFVGLFVPQLTFLMAITMATSIDTAIMSTLGPIFTMIFAFFFLGEPITIKKAGGVALSFVGVIFLIFNSVHSGGASASSTMGIVLLLINSISFAMYLGIFLQCPLGNRLSDLLRDLRGIFPDTLRTEAPAPHAGEHVHLPPARNRRYYKYLGGDGRADMAENPRHRPDCGRSDSGEPQQGGIQLIICG